ncbi:nucleoside hydrolase [Nocardiopsis sp. NPDC006938]|uniref:nucleoside hydrolase n=1 Tax=Nocardiopsis sp. NPDC006938 TaxID=3364337 RepID=UPI003694677A
MPHSEETDRTVDEPLGGRRAPIVLDTDVGGDPDDAVAVAAAARSVPGLALVLTNDETGGSVGYGQRARLARRLLDLLGRPDVPVVAGHGSGGTRYFCAGTLVPGEVPAQPRDVVGAVRDLLSRTEGVVRWVGMGALSNLALVLSEVPEARERLCVTQMGGALNYRNPSVAEHNIRMDVGAAHRVFSAIGRGRLTGVRLVISDVTFRTDIEVDRDSALYRRLSVFGEHTWQGLLHRHLDLWFDSFHPGSIQHDALTLSAALDLPFVHLDRAEVALDDRGRMSLAPGGAPVWLSASATYAPFNRWLEDCLFLPEGGGAEQG